MNDDKASPTFIIRAVLQGFGDPQSLANILTRGLPNGVCCFVVEDQAIWSLNRDSNVGTVDGQSQAGNGGGTWFLQSVSDAFSGGAEVLSTDYNAFAPLDGNWHQTTDSDSALTGTPTNWALTPAGYILTYTGSTRDFYVTLAGAVRVGNADAVRTAFLGISKNNDVTGAPAFGTSGAIDTTLAAANSDVSIVTVRKVTLASGDTLRPKMSGPAASVEMSAVLRMIVAPG